jgi:predicted AAA+ superfamily ATPase
MMMKPWREITVPHKDVLEGTFQQSEFAADITAVHVGKASNEYQNAIAFFDRTFITEGMRLLLTQVAQRLSGEGGEPVIQLQTAFGGGKTHTMLAVYHLANRKCSLSDLAGIPQIVERAGLMEVPQARVAVLDGTAHAPGQLWKHGKQQINTLWGELAWQLGGSDGFALVQGSDTAGTSPGKDVLRELLSAYAPCVVLIDELVAYIRQFSEGQKLSGGTYDSNLSFVQALTEAVKLVPNAIVLASLPESEVEAGSQRAVAALRALEKTFGRVQALWKPIATEEAFEIVRRRLFEPVRDAGVRDAVCRAFADAYIAEDAKLPAETQERRYYDRLVQAYPIHPEIFDRLYEDWTTIDGFQRTRGVLKLMAKVIYRLWKDENKDLLILPGSLPLQDGSTRNELTYYLPAGWDAVLERDIDGERAETTELESKEPRFGQVGAARRVARAIFLGSAPSSVATKKVGIHGIDRARVILGCLQPGQTSSVYSDALNRLVDRLHYLNSSGDKTQDTTRFWFDTRANLRREMEDRKRRFDDKTEVRGKIADALNHSAGSATFFDGVHVFTPHADVPDDSSLRLVVLTPESWYSREEARPAMDAVLEWMQNNGPKPRHRWNRLLFLAADHATLSRLNDAARVMLAWGSIVDDVDQGRLNIDRLQETQAKKELQTAKEVLPRAARECYRWLLCPTQEAAQDKPSVEAFSLHTAGSSVSRELERICTENELVITGWSPIHLRTKLKELYWKEEQPAALAATFWEDSLRYLYLPRLKDRDVFARAILDGAGSKDFFGTAYGQTDGKYDGFKFGDKDVQIYDTLLLIEPNAAKLYQEAQAAATKPVTTAINDHGLDVVDLGPSTSGGNSSGLGKTGSFAATAPKSFHGTVDIAPTTAKMRLVRLADEIIALLASDPNASVKVVLEISAEFPDGVKDNIKRAVSENANSLALRSADWE